MMCLQDYNGYCGALPQTTHVVQWGGAHVWKIGGKVFAIGGWSKEEHPYITFKCTQLGFEILKEQPGLRPAPYLASRGFTWIQMYDEPGLSEDELKDYIKGSYDLVASGLTKKKRKELGIEG